MKIVIDSSVLIDLERKRGRAADVLSALARENHELILSTITVSEILTGAYMGNREGIQSAKELLGQFRWIGVDGFIAERTAQLIAWLYSVNREVEYQDVVIAATAITTNADFLLSENKKDFVMFPPLKNKTFTAAEFEKLISKTSNRKS